MHELSYYTYRVVEAVPWFLIGVWVTVGPGFICLRFSRRIKKLMESTLDEVVKTYAEHVETHLVELGTALASIQEGVKGLDTLILDLRKEIEQYNIPIGDAAKAMLEELVQKSEELVTAAQGIDVKPPAVPVVPEVPVPAPETPEAPEAPAETTEPV